MTDERGNHMYHPRITDATTAYLIGPQRTSELKAMLESEQQVFRTSPRDSYDERVADSNIADLKRLIVLSAANDLARERAASARTAADDAKRSERQAADDAALKATIRTEFMGQAGVTDADFDRLYPTLRDQHLIRQSGEALAIARQRIGRL